MKAIDRMTYRVRGCAALFLLTLAAAAPGATVDDPYQWLEELHGERALAWVEQENQRTLGILEKDPRYAQLHAEALAIAQADDRIPMPSFTGGSLYNFWQDATHVRGIWRRTSVAGYQQASPPWETVLDIDALAKAEGANWFFQGADCEQPREQRCLVSLSDGGEDAATLREFDLATRAFVPGGFTLPRSKPRVAWESRDALLVATEWTPGELTTSGYPFVVKRLLRGQPLSAAVELFRGAPADGGYGVQPVAFVDGTGHRLTLIERPLSTFESEYYVVAGGRVQRLAIPARLGLEAMVAGQLVLGLHQDWEPSPGQHFSQGSLVALDARALEADPQHPKPVAVYVPGPREAFESSAATRDALLVTSLDNVSGRATVYRPDGKGGWTHTPLPVPPLSTVSITSTDLHGDHAYLGVSGFLQPTRLLLLDVRTAALHESRSLPPKFDASGLVVEQFAATSGDGTQVPYFIVHKAGMKADGNNPTIIDAYGGFLISNTPTYGASMGKLWLERGGVFVLANIRGGGEFGPAWHDAGLKTRRQLIYDDFTAVARDLFARGITSARRLGIQGGSNGGLLMGVQFTQHPEMWNAVDIQVPLLDMLRYEQIQAGSSWVGEYGSVSVPEERAFLASISPYANIRRDRNYPEPLVWTTTKDDRVGPQHARKFAARLKEYGLPYLFYEATEGGHGAGANLNERAHTTALEYTYFARKLMD